MIIFNAFLKVLKKNIFTVILYTVILVVFTVFSMKTDSTGVQFTGTMPEIYVENNDTDSVVTDNLMSYLKEKTNIKDISGGEEAISDALFYKEISLVIKIPSGYGNDILAGKDPQLSVRKDGTYNSELSVMQLSKYLRVQKACLKITKDPDSLVREINNSLSKSAEIELATVIDTNMAAKTAGFFDFAAYSITACIVFIICLVLTSFNEINVRKRTIVSSLPITAYNAMLMLSSCIYMFIVFVFFGGISLLIVGSYMLSLRGLMYLINTLAFSVATLSMAYLLSSVFRSRDAVTGVVNVVALGSSFLCGAFVPASMLPSWVLGIAHILPAYWFINSNDRLSEIEQFDLSSLQPIFINMIVLIGFAGLFFVLSVLVSRRKQRIA